MSEPTPIVVRNDDKNRYEIHLDDTVAGFTEFEADDHGRLAFPHTEVDPAFGGRGLGGTLVGQAMADVAARGETVVPVCPFVVKYLHSTEVPGLDIAWRPTADEAGSNQVDSPDA
ncbi:GNAT family N-acetyltransferase [Microbacterium sp.]|uniref:GNAT family N-acetyltransferase n=1 Tax=Microbacterium sp. TaxID=51671 RepID=UPI0025EAD68A|nr:GNAT family N-acetyltransferase [Microbacterium sp.]